MRTSPINTVIDHLRRAVLLPDGAGLGDGELLDSFIESHDEAAFAALVKRHGPMVWGVCRRLLHQHDAEDAFQATFLVLARKAASIRSKATVGNWLYGVAHQTALQARRAIARRRAKEVQVTKMPDTEAVEPDVWADLQPVLDEELSRLPDIYRAVVVLCDLEGRTRKEVACLLGVPEGTVGGRLARARTMLAKRLTQRGVIVSGGVLAAVLWQNVAAAGVPSSVVSSTIKAALCYAAGQTAASVITTNAAILTEGVLRAMLMSKLKTATAVLMVVALCCGATGMICGTQAGEPQKAENPAEQKVKAKVEGERQATTDSERLQGKWQIMSLDLGGIVIKREAESSQWKDTFEKEMFFQGDRYGQVGHSNSKFKLDETRDPKQITVYSDDGKLTYRGIYAIEGDTLKLCMNGDGTSILRPEEFVTKKGSPVIITTLKKVATKK